ncbi:AEC family transporter [Aestuariivirga sp.]|uniref:AEC family transporter n=1 Tax=Aestuariivirga sp. TaxID=2650926 RepID=UPI0039E5E445
MTAAILGLLPVFIVILVGYGLRRSGLIDAHHWDAVDHVCYYVLFPAIIFKEIASADFTGVPVWRMSFAMIMAIITMFALLLWGRKRLCDWLGLDGPQFTSVFQGSTRWHTFIAFAIIPIYFGQKALALGGLSSAAMTPLLNIVNVAVISIYGLGHRPDNRALLRSIIRNPFVLSSLGGVAWQLLHLPVPGMGVQVLDMIGKGALGLALLTVGAGLKIDEALSTKAPVIFATSAKLLLMPLFMAVWLVLLGVHGEAAQVAMLCSAVPTGSGAYVLARRMGGDASLIASIMTMQVITAAFTLPLVLWLAGVTG